MLSEDKYFCRVCGLKCETPPWGEDNNSSTFEFCLCCGTEFGYQDATLFAGRKSRERWIAAGAIWDEPESKPANWSLEEQLGQIPDQYL